jgi:flagellar motility protein MotE (MotC chaperone)
VTRSRSWRGGVADSGGRAWSWFAALLLALAGLAVLRLSLTLAGALEPTTPGPPAPLRQPLSAVVDTAQEWLPEPAAGPASATAESSVAATEVAADSAGEMPPVDLDPANMAPSEIALLHQLAARRAVLDRRERALDQRAVLLAGAAADLEQQIARLSALRDEIAAAIDAHDAAEEAKLASLVKIYETMKPKAAAEIFDRLEMPVLIEVVERMREVKSADVLARMDPVKAKEVTSELARRSELLEASRATTRPAARRADGS